MDSTIGVNQETYTSYRNCYIHKRGNSKYCLSYEAFSRKLKSGKTITVDKHEFMSNETFNNWLKTKL
jgi:hypothetical protein